MENQLSENMATACQISKPEEKGKFKLKGRRLGRGAVQSGLTHECGVFGCVATGDWPTQVI